MYVYSCPGFDVGQVFMDPDNWFALPSEEIANDSFSRLDLSGIVIDLIS